MSTNPNQAQLKAGVFQMRAGWSQTGVWFPQTMVIRGQVMTPAAVLQRLDAFFTLLDAPDQARLKLLAAVAERREGEPAGWRFFADLSSVVIQQFGDQDAHQRFGLEPPKAPALPSSETLVLANHQRQQTRKARGVMGRRQREALTPPAERLVIVAADSAYAEPAATATPAVEAEPAAPTPRPAP